jgi:CHASE1-domain containing sensor protein
MDDPLKADVPAPRAHSPPSPMQDRHPFLRMSARAREWAAFVAWTGFVVALARVTHDIGFVVVLGVGYGATLVAFLLARMVARRRRSSRQPSGGS